MTTLNIPVAVTGTAGEGIAYSYCLTCLIINKDGEEKLILEKTCMDKYYGKH
ncbi:MAG: hypothetical protein ACOC6D_03345 [Atribacterota bacterium]